MSGDKILIKNLERELAYLKEQVQISRGLVDSVGARYSHAMRALETISNQSHGEATIVATQALKLIRGNNEAAK